MRWSEVSFGKFKDKGKSLPQIVFLDPDWFFWAFENGAFPGYLNEEAEEVYHKARNIRIIQRHSEKIVAEYCIHQPSGKFGCLEFVPASRPPHIGSSRCFRGETIDLSFARQVSKYDKTGSSLLVSAAKRHLFGPNARLTKSKCENFFSDKANFNI